ncbi:MAG: carboxypeptidase-like regulatory domain-containing protein [Balneolaceae bacterium]
MIRGKVIDSETKKPVPFAHVFVKNGEFGAVTKSDGIFVLNLSPSENPDSLTITSLGYHNTTVAANSDDFITIYLEPRIYQMSDIAVNAVGANKKDTLGTISGPGSAFGWPSFGAKRTEGDMHSSFAIPVKWMHDVPFTIDKARIRIAKASVDSLIFRFRFLSKDSVTSLPDSNLVNENIVVSKTQSSGWIEFELEPGKYWFHEKEFFLVFDWMSDGQSRKYIAPMFSHKSGSGSYFLYKHATDSNWSRQEKELIYTIFIRY